jgi:hypothetical protein
MQIPAASRVGGTTLEENGAPLPIVCAKKPGEWPASVAHHETKESAL